MTGRTDLLFAFAAAVALHAGAFALGFAPGSGGGAGHQGEDRVTVQMASPATLALIREWDIPPDTSPAPTLAEPDVRPVETAVTSFADTLPMRDAPQAPQAEVPSAAPQAALRQPSFPEAPAATDALVSLSGPTSVLPSQITAPKAPVAPPVSSGQMPDTRPPPPAADVAPRLVRRPTARPVQNSVANAQRVAKGAGAGVTRGVAHRQEAPKVSDTSRRAAANAWAATIQQRIARHHSYPGGTRAEGRVRVAMVILSDGRLDRVSVAKSSGTRALDAAALEAVKRAAPFPPAPDELDDKWFNVGQWIAFERR